MSSLDDEDRFGPVGAPQLTAFGLGLSALLAMIGFVKARVHSRTAREATMPAGGVEEARNADKGRSIIGTDSVFQTRAQPAGSGNFNRSPDS